MLSRLPHEIRLSIFYQLYFDPCCGGDIRLEDTAKGIKFNFSNNYHENIYAGALSCLDATVLGEGVAAAAAEALYRSNFTFGVSATILPTFLERCPLSNTVQPGKYIRKLEFYMEEDPEFIGDGKTGKDLRKADWVDLGLGSGDDGTTDSTEHTKLMRRCWRAILEMPRLQRFDFLIMPSRDPGLERGVERFEIRDIIPTHFRLFCKNVVVKVYYRLSHNKNQYMPPRKIPARLSHPKACRGGFYESYVDIGECIPRWCAEPTAEARAKAEAVAESLGGGLPLICLVLYAWFGLQDVRDQDALKQYRRRLGADKGGYSFMIVGCRNGG